MPPSDPAAIGPLDDLTLRPARTAAQLRAGCLLAVLVAVFVGCAVTAPTIAAGLGLSRQVQATVTSVSTGRGDEYCDRVHTVTYSWGDGETGSEAQCWSAGQPRPEIGSSASIWVLPGWDRVVVGSRSGDAGLAVAAIVIVLVTGVGAAYYLRRLWILRALRRGAVRGQVLAARSEQRLVGHGRAATTLRFDDARFRPLRLGPRPVLDGTRPSVPVTVHALGRTMRGRPAGPYVIRRIDGNGASTVSLGPPVRRSRQA